MIPKFYSKGKYGAKSNEKSIPMKNITFGARKMYTLSSPCWSKKGTPFFEQERANQLSVLSLSQPL